MASLRGSGASAKEATKCPTCGSPSPERHPAVQHGGEVGICGDAFHLRPTNLNKPEYIAAVEAKRERPTPTLAIMEQAAEIAEQHRGGFNQAHDRLCDTIAKAIRGSVPCDVNYARGKLDGLEVAAKVAENGPPFAYVQGQNFDEPGSPYDRGVADERKRIASEIRIFAHQVPA